MKIMTSPKRFLWIVLLLCNPYCCPVFAQESKATDDEIKLLIEQAATTHDLPILFGGDFGLFGPGELRHKRIAEQAAMIMGRFSNDQRLKQFAPATQKLIKIGVPALPQIHEKVKSAKINDPSLLNLIDALAYIGNQESIGFLIDKYRLADDTFKLLDAPGVKPKTDRFAIGNLQQKCVVAIWKLTGRHHALKSAEWKSWWKEIKPYYVSQRKETF